MLPLYKMIIDEANQIQGQVQDALEEVYRLELSVASARYTQKTVVEPALEVEDARLLGIVTGSNETQRRAQLVFLKTTDENYLWAKISSDDTVLLLEQMAADIKHAAHRYRAALSALEYKTQLLQYLAGWDTET